VVPRALSRVSNSFVRMADKNRERGHLEALAEGLNDPSLIEAVNSESPDFILARSPSIGIEVTDFSYRYGSFSTSVREQSSLRDRAVELAEELYYAHSPIQDWDAEFEFRDWPRLTKPRVNEVANYLASLLTIRKDFLQLDNSEFMGTYTIPQIPEVARIQATRVTTRDHGVWQPALGGWVYHAGSGEIESIVREKEKNLSRYKQSCELIWLVIVFDIHSAGDRVAEPALPVSFAVDSSFDRLLCLDAVSRRVIEVPITRHQV